ncbi:hypothetical protein [Brevibacterium pityocampae]|uniref:Lipoprotein n=1 Tax=Brevibacterium pityocampae TaxID=506594 RepID=A0ABP8J1H7_9MICO
MRRRIQALCAAGAAVLLAGCGAFQVRTSEEGGGVMGVRVAQTAGPTPTPTETGPALADGYQLVDVPFSEGCGVPMRVAVPDGFSVGSSAGDYVTFVEGTAALDDPTISIYCSDSVLSETAAEHIETTRSYGYQEAGTTKIAERKGQFGNGYFWSYQVDMSPREIFAGTSQTMLYGADIAYTAEGRLCTLKYAATAPTEDVAGQHRLQPAADFVEVDGRFVPMPDWAG